MLQSFISLNLGIFYVGSSAGVHDRMKGQLVFYSYDNALGATSVDPGLTS